MDAGIRHPYGDELDVLTISLGVLLRLGCADGISEPIEALRFVWSRGALAAGSGPVLRQPAKVSESCPASVRSRLQMARALHAISAIPRRRTPAAARG